jgi:hypothetical protein
MEGDEPIITLVAKLAEAAAPGRHCLKLLHTGRRKTIHRLQWKIASKKLLPEQTSEAAKQFDSWTRIPHPRPEHFLTNQNQRSAGEETAELVYQ